MLLRRRRIAPQNLLEDPSYLEKIMANAAKLLPAVPITDGGVFKRAVSHHCALRTANIARAMKFYSLLGLNEVRSFAVLCCAVLITDSELLA